MIALAEEEHIEDIYYLYAFEYELRDKLYQMTMGENRCPPADLYRYLRDMIPSQKVLTGLRGCGLIKFKKQDLINGLHELKKNGYPDRFKGMEKRIIIGLFLK